VRRIGKRELSRRGFEEDSKLGSEPLVGVEQFPSGRNSKLLPHKGLPCRALDEHADLVRTDRQAFLKISYAFLR